jgi:hypothetical protein
MSLVFDERCATAASYDRVTVLPAGSTQAVVEYSGQHGTQPDGQLSKWPISPVIIPGSSCTIILETATDVENKAELSRFCIRVVVTGHCVPNLALQPLAYLGREFAHLTAVLLGQQLSVHHDAVVGSADILASERQWVPAPLASLHAAPLGDLCVGGLQQSAYSVVVGVSHGAVSFPCASCVLFCLLV